MPVDTLSPLERLPIFTGLGLEALELLAAKASTNRVKEGAVILREGETGRQMFLIVSGAVRICKHKAAGGDVELARLGAGDFFGEMCILDTLPRSATVAALEETVLLGLDSMAFLALYNQMPKDYGIVLLNMARDLSRRLRKLDAFYGARA